MTTHSDQMVLAKRGKNESDPESSFSLESMKKLLEEVRTLNLPPTKSEATLFSVLGRSHHENPLTDALKFFMNPDEEHGFGSLFLEAFFACMPEGTNIPLDLNLASEPSREVVTGAGNKIDLIIPGPNWVLVIEHKIFHEVLNPLDEYQNFIKKSYPNRRWYFALLGIANDPQIQSWPWVPYHRFLKEIDNRHKKMTKLQNKTKWNLMLSDYLIHMRRLAGVTIMDQESISFVAKNYHQIHELSKHLENYRSWIHKRGIDSLHAILKDESLQTKMERWDGMWAIIFIPASLQGSQIRIILRDSGDMRLDIVTAPVIEWETIEKKLQSLRFITNTEDTGKRHWFGQTESYPDIESLLEGLVNAFQCLSMAPRKGATA